MINQLKNWPGEVEIDGQHYNSIQDALQRSPGDFNESTCIKLLCKQQNAVNESQTVQEAHSDEVKITVKQYMTKPASPEFDFMLKWNNNVPMPMRTMIGKTEKETRGMVYMNLHGFGYPTVTCAVCGKELTNPVSRHYGIGPICLSKMGISRDIEDVDGIKEDLAKIEWSGWIIKSAIVDKEEVE